MILVQDPARKGERWPIGGEWSPAHDLPLEKPMKVEIKGGGVKKPIFKVSRSVIGKRQREHTRKLSRQRETHGYISDNWSKNDEMVGKLTMPL